MRCTYAIRLKRLCYISSGGKLLTNNRADNALSAHFLYAMQFSIFARSFSLIAAEHPVKVAGITKAAAICNLRDGIFGGA